MGHLRDGGLAALSEEEEVDFHRVAVAVVANEMGAILKEVWGSGYLRLCSVWQPRRPYYPTNKIYTPQTRRTNMYLLTHFRQRGQSGF